MPNYGHIATLRAVSVADTKAAGEEVANTFKIRDHCGEDRT